MKESVKPQDSESRKRYISLRYRFVITSFLLLSLMFSVVALVVGGVQTRTIREQIEDRGMATARNLAAVSVSDLVTYNYMVVEKNVNQIVKMPDLVAVVVHDKEGRVAGYSGRPDLQGQKLDDEFTQIALEGGAPRVSIRDSKGSEILEASIPVLIPSQGERRWGTVRVFLSLDSMHQQISQTRMGIGAIGIIAIVLGSWMADLAARRVTQPLGTLVEATVEAAGGNLDPDIQIQTRDEVEILASNFSVMIREILAQQGQLEDQVHEISQLRQYAEKILATMSDGLLAVDMGGCVAAVNPAAHGILGLDGDEDGAVGRSIDNFPPEAAPLVDHIQEVLERGMPIGQREIRLKWEGEGRIILVGQGSLGEFPGEAEEMIFNLNDITELKKLEAQVRQGQRLADLGVMAAGMAHEIRNPLSAIKTFVALLPNKIEKPGFLDKFQRTVPREINRLNSLIDELLVLSRPPQYNFNPTDMGGVLTRMTELLEADFKERGIDCQWDIPMGLPRVSADVHQLEKVFMNLLQNGAQAMPAGGALSLSVAHGEDLVIQVRDTGQGIDSKALENIFTPFFTTKAKGTGLGLAISHKVISEHGGRIQATSRPGEGSCFIVHLPVLG